MVSHIMMVAWLIIIAGWCFQFKAPYVSVYPSTINTLSQYQINVQRQFTQQVTNTAWNTTAVPVGSSIVAIFPIEYTFTGAETCDMLVLGADMPAFTCAIDPYNRTVSFNGAITTNMFISDVAMTISHVLNPYPAITTSPFLVTIGNDQSANDQFAAVILTAAQFAQSSINFNPTTVNSTGSMQISLVTTNKLPVGSYITIKFPYNLQWTEDVSSSHQLPLPSAMSCSSLSSSVSASISCVGQSSVQLVTVSNISPTQIQSGTTLKFSISNLFSPPSQNPVDTLTITSITSNSSGSFMVDSSSTAITGLTAKLLTDLAFASTTVKTINTNIGLRATFTLLDTVTNVDYFQFVFPIGTTITNSTALSTFSLSPNFSYNSATGVLTLTQTTVSQTRFSGLSAYLTFVSYRTPNSTKPTAPIVFRIMKNGYAKMRGSVIFTADPKVYSFMVSVNDTGINAKATYTIAITLSDALDRSGYMVLTLPQQLTLDPSLSLTAPIISITSSSPTYINSNPTITPINATSFFVTNLNKTATSTQIPTQSLTISISGILQPNAAQTVGNFYISLYLNSQGYLTAYGNQSNTISIVSGTITNFNAGTSISVTASTAELIINSTIQNSVPVNGYIYYLIPTQILTPASPICQLSSTSVIYTSSCTVSVLSASTVRVTLHPSSLIPAQTTLKLSIQGVTTPASTYPTGTFGMGTANQNNKTIDVMTGSVTIGMLQAVALSNIQVVRSSVTNYQTSQYSLSFQIPQSLYSNTSNIINLQFPSQIIASSFSISLTNEFNATSALTYNIISLSPLKVSISLGTRTNLNNTVLQVYNLINPPSLRATVSGIAVTVGFNRTVNSITTTYLYATGTSSVIQNTIVADFGSLSYTYSKPNLFTQSNLTITFALIAASKVSIVQIQLDTSLKFKDSPTLSVCTSSQLSILCTITNTSPSVVQISPKSPSTSFVTNSSISIIIGTIITPSSYSSSYPASSMTSFDSSNFPISRNLTYIKFAPMCSIPCLQCISGQPTQCTSCYQYGQNATNLYYYLPTANTSYGQCLASCPSGTYNASYTCLSCNSNCKECIGNANYCTLCPTNMYLYSSNNSCVSTCPSGTYSNVINSTNVCSTCPIGCELCSSATVCSKCATGYFLYNSACSSSCPFNITIPNTVTRVCDPCASSCLTCQVSTTKCTSCVSSLVLNNGSCLSQCTTITMIPVNGTCTACASPCYTCSITITNCTSCLSASSFPLLFNGNCVSQCPQTYYSSVSTSGKCVSCAGLNIGCLNCSTNGQYCLSCDVGYVYYNNTQCLNYVPSGFANISGNAVACSNSCASCQGSITYCTSCTSPLYLYMNTCISQCPNTTTPILRSCAQCLQPCSTCSGSQSFCLSCLSPYFLNSQTHSCVSSTNCPNYTYPNSSTSACAQCVSPCLRCTTSVACTSCIRGFYFYSVTVLCLDVCPNGWVGVVDACVKCVEPCRYCEGDANSCTSCISGYYLNPFTRQCLLQCPANVTIPNPLTMTCDICSNSCATCVNQITQCTSCVTGTFLLGTQCLSTCPTGYFGSDSTKKCQICSTLCKTCSLTSTKCTSCYGGKHLFNNECIETCPPTHGIIDSNNNCALCDTVFSSCITCTSTQCIACQQPTILLQGKCYSECPSGYVLDTSGTNCISTDQNAQQQLNNTLSSSSVFPMPFTCIGFSIFIAFLMSKLQNKNTYLIGSGYGLLGVLETASLIFLIIKYIGYNTPLQSGLQQTDSSTVVKQFPILTVGLIIILAINLLGFAVQTPILYKDDKFQQWLKNPFHLCMFISTTILSLLVNYKLKLFLFSKLFGFSSTRAQLESVQKFRVFNVLSFIGVSHEIFVIYISIVMLIKLPNSILNNQLFLVFIDVIVITAMAVVFSILANKKDDDFFTEIADNGYVLNKKVMIEGDDMIKQPLQPKYLRGDENRKLKTQQMDSFQKMINQNQQQIYEDEQISLSISQNRSEMDRRQRQRKKQKHSEVSDNQNNEEKKKNGKVKNNKNNKLNDSNQETSNPINKQLLHLGEKDQELNQQGKKLKKSVIFDRQKDFDEEEVVSKNQTVLIESPSKSTKKAVGTEDLLMINNNETKNNNTDEVKKAQNQKIQKQQYTANEKQSLQKIQQQRKQKKVTDSLLNNKKQASPKVYRQQKEISKQDMDSEQIKNKIALKLKQLQGLKRQNSQKQLRRSKQKDKSSKMNEQIKSKPYNQQKLKQKQQQQGKNQKKQFGSFFNSEPHDINTTQQLHYNDSLPIKQSSTLIRQQQQIQKQKQKELQQEKLHDAIIEDIDVTNSLAISGLNPFEKNKGIKEGTLFNKSKLNDQNRSKIQEQILQGSKDQKQKQIVRKNGVEKTEPIQQESTAKINDKLKQQKQHEKQIKIEEEIDDKKGAQKQKLKLKQALEENKSKGEIENNSNGHKMKQNIENMYDSIIKATDQDNNKAATNQQEQNGKQNKDKFNFIENIQENMSDEQNRQNKGSYQIVSQSKQKQRKSQKNVFDFENEQQQFQDSGLEDSQPCMDEEINYRPMKSSFTTDRKSVDITKTQENSQKHPLIGIIQSGRQGISAKHQIPKTADEGQAIQNRDDQNKTKMHVYGGGAFPVQQKTMRKHQDKPPLQRPSTNQRNRIYAAGLRQFEDQSQISSQHHANQTNSKNSFQQQIQQMEKQKKRNKSLNQMIIKKQVSNQSKDSSEITDQIVMKPGYFQNSSSQDVSFANPKYTSTMLVDSGNDIPQKPKIGLTSRVGRTSTSHERGGRMRMDPNLTAGQHLWTKKTSVQYDQDGEDELIDFYGKNRQTKKSKSPKRSKQKQRNPSKQSIKRMKQIQKVYLQRLQPPPKRKQ